MGNRIQMEKRAQANVQTRAAQESFLDESIALQKAVARDPAPGLLAIVQPAPVEPVKSADPAPVAPVRASASAGKVPSPPAPASTDATN